ncbi:pentatricopeptide repeat-containing protein At2g13600-like [Magnolia sinica]|uniref:pentatricopeptide repeat-containing protein At2g13600-like n=1 Tax=Magnolia sinica TaxID=86752 RepID=UPI002657D857|nr:pentatricopeptide repeat-containing protein At2g13600-like [Magnolia sinica]
MMSTGLVRNGRVACMIADRIDGQDTYKWNSIIRGYLERNSPKEAILAYAHVIREGLKIDSHTLLFTIKACGRVSGSFEGAEIHAHIFKMGFESEIITQTALVQMYVLFHDLLSAQRVFDETPQRDLVLWNTLVATYTQMGQPRKALSVSYTMINENVGPNGVTVASILSACSSLRALEQGKLIHGFVIKCIMGPDVFVYNALIGMYAKCGCLSHGRRIFERMAGRNVVSWTSMINGYSDNGRPHEALALFREMESDNVRPDGVALLGLVNMCSKLGCFELGEWADQYIKRNGYDESTCMANALMDMHAKCGNVKEACRIFSRMTAKTLVSWTTMIQGLAMHGHGIAALVRFSQMQREGFRPDGIVFLSILGACSHAGLVNEGRRCFRLMIEEHGVVPWMEHYGCMVDLLCRAGLLNEALEFVERMPMEPDVVMWRALVGACKNQGNIALARKVMRQLLELEPKDSGNYILISNLYATIGEWDNVMEVRNEMGYRGVIKIDPGCSLMEVKDHVNFS